MIKVHLLKMKCTDVVLAVERNGVVPANHKLNCDGENDIIK